MFKKIIRNHKCKFIFVVIISIINSLVYVFAGYSLSFLVTGYEKGMQLNTLLKNGCQVLGIWIITLIIMFFYSILQQKLLCLMRTDLRRLMGEKIISLDYKEFIEKDTGNYVSWMTNDVEQITKQVFENFFKIIDSIMLTIFSLIALFYLGVWIGVAAIVLFFIISIVPQLASKGMEKKSTDLSAEQEKSTELFKENINGYNIYLVSNRKQFFLTKLCEISKKLEGKYYLLQRESTFLGILGAFVSLFGQIIMILVSIAMAIAGVTPIGAIISVGNLGQTFFSNTASAIGSMITANASKKIWKKYIIENDKREKISLINDTSSINIKNLSYYYGEKSVLKDVNIIFEKGKKYTIIGESGSGKSTLGKIVAGLYLDYVGSVLVGNSEIRDINSEELYNTITYVDQQVFIFGVSIRENITLGEIYDDDEIWRILKICNLLDYVKNLEGGLDYIIEENGKNLSGGQKQRIALARALIRNVEYIIIDEGTSALDAKNAKEIEETLINNENICLILISHHLSEDTIARMDLIYEIN